MLGDHPGAIWCTKHCGGGDQGYHLPASNIPSYRHTLWNWWNFHIPHRQRHSVELVKLEWWNFHISNSQRNPVELPYFTQTETPCGTSISHTARDNLWNWCNCWNFHISHRQRHPVELVELVEVPYLAQPEIPYGTGGTSIYNKARDTLWNWWNWWNFHISSSQI